jgi:transposase
VRGYHRAAGSVRPQDRQCRPDVCSRYGYAFLVQQELGQDPLPVDLFVFRSRRGDRLKLLYWDEDGFVLIYKRLEAGTFRFPPADENGVEIRAADLQLLLDGIDLDSVQRRHRYRRPMPA